MATSIISRSTAKAAAVAQLLLLLFCIDKQTKLNTNCSHNNNKKSLRKPKTFSQGVVIPAPVAVAAAPGKLKEKTQ